jgi:hypothetical protein
VEKPNANDTPPLQILSENFECAEKSDDDCHPPSLNHNLPDVKKSIDDISNKVFYNNSQ